MLPNAPRVGSAEKRCGETPFRAAMRQTSLVRVRFAGGRRRSIIN